MPVLRVQGGYFNNLHGIQDHFITNSPHQLYTVIYWSRTVLDRKTTPWKQPHYCSPISAVIFQLIHINAGGALIRMI